jgi:hypothetical protein
MARAAQLDPRAAAARRRRLLLVLGGLVVLAALAAAASRFSRWWRVPAVPVAAAPAGVLAAMKHGLCPAAGGELPWGPLNMRPQLNASGDLVATPAQPDGNVQYFEGRGFPWVPGLRQLGSTWADDFASGSSAFESRFASPDSAAALIAYYQRRLGEKGMTQAGGDTVTWVLKRATGHRGIERRVALTIGPYNITLEGWSPGCQIAPPTAARAVVTLGELSWVRKWRRPRRPSG